MLDPYKKEIIRKELKMAQNFAMATAPYRKNGAYEYESNCYTYALGVPERGKSVPGKLCVLDDMDNRMSRAEITVPNIFNMLVKDRLQPISPDEVTANSQSQIIAAYVEAGVDYHFFRMHKDGYWSHQKGRGGEITHLDYSQNRIRDPQQADRKWYQDFVGFFKVPDEGVDMSIPLIKAWSMEPVQA